MRVMASAPLEAPGTQTNVRLFICPAVTIVKLQPAITGQDSPSAERPATRPFTEPRLGRVRRRGGSSPASSAPFPAVVACAHMSPSRRTARSGFSAKPCVCSDLLEGERRDSNPRPPGPQPGQAGCPRCLSGSVEPFELFSVGSTCSPFCPRIRPRRLEWTSAYLAVGEATVATNRGYVNPWAGCQRRGQSGGCVVSRPGP